MVFIIIVKKLRELHPVILVVNLAPVYIPVALGRSADKLLMTFLTCDLDYLGPEEVNHPYQYGRNFVSLFCHRASGTVDEFQIGVDHPYLDEMQKLYDRILFDLIEVRDCFESEAMRMLCSYVKKRAIETQFQWQNQMACPIDIVALGHRLITGEWGIATEWGPA